VSFGGHRAAAAIAPEGCHKTLILLCVSIPSFMINLDSNIVAVSLSSIAHALHADFAGIEWVVSTYTLTFASLVMPAGALADRYGRKRMLLLGLAIFTVASFICGAAPNVAVLNAARALQGVGAALQLSAAIATLSHVFRGAERARAFAFWGSVIGVAITLGPVAGGFITQQFGWAWAFYVNVPVGVALIPLVLYAVTESRDPDARRIDLAGFVSFSAGLFLITLALISGNHAGWGSRPIIIEFTAAAVLFAIFIIVETLQARPMLDLRFFRQPTYIGANIAAVAFAAALLTMLTYLPIYFQRGLGYAPQTAGLLMLPMAIPLFVVPRVTAGYLSYRLTGRALLAIGLGLVAIGLCWIGIEAPRFDYAAMLGGMLVAGAGAGVLNGETTKVGMTVIPPERAGMASGVGGTVRFSGIVVGFAALGTILFSSIAATVRAAWPAGSAADQLDLVRSIAAGDLSGAGVGPRLAAGLGAGSQGMLRALAVQSFGHGYQAILFAAAALAAAAALLSWLLVRAAETPPLPRRMRAAAPLAAPVE
jgi:EmrB/QacA subfamily drug resistance transporter